MNPSEELKQLADEYAVTMSQVADQEEPIDVYSVVIKRDELHKAIDAVLLRKTKEKHASINVMQTEIQRLKMICQSTHRRLLRGDSDKELLAMLQEAWQFQKE